MEKSISYCYYIIHHILHIGPPLWSSGQNSWLQIQRSRIRFPRLPDFLRSSGSGMGSVRIIEDYLNGKVAAPV
jgi:hypothetical protein